MARVLPPGDVLPEPTGFAGPRPALTLLNADETLDAICGGTVRVVQRSRGYRFNLDSVLLAHFAAEDTGPGSAIDLGTGGAIVPLLLARKFGWQSIIGLEIQPSLYRLARRNVELNRCEQVVSLALGDLRDVDRMFPRAAFTHVLSNPPYLSLQRGRLNAEVERAIARHEVLCAIEDIAAAAEWLLREGGAVHVVYPASRLGELMTAMRAYRLEPERLRLVHPRHRRPARRVLVTARKGSHPDLSVLPPLFVHHEDGFSEELQVMLGEQCSPML